MKLYQHSFEEKSAMRKRYGYWALRMIAVLTVLFSFGAANAQIPNPKFYPTLAVTDYSAYPDGIIRVPQPSVGGDRYFYIPVFIYNETDPAYNPNIGGQFLEPIRSFEFQMTYLTQAMSLDTQASHGSPISVVGPTAPTATATQSDTIGIAKNFYIRWSDVADPGVVNNPFRHRIRISAASEIPLPKTTPADTATSILLWIRFKVINTAVNASILQLDSSLFNDHPGDPMANSLTWPAGNFGPGTGSNNPSKGSGLVQLTPQPAFEFRPFSQVTTTDNRNYDLVTDLVYDPTINGGTNPTRSIQIRNANGGTRLTNISVCSDQPWLLVSSPNPPGSKQCEYIPRIDYTGSVGSEEKDLWITANPGAVSPGLLPGIYEGYITLTSEGAANSPARIKVRFIVRRSPNEPSAGSGTGVRLTITNSCVPNCSSTLAFGTGKGATAGVDPLYGETLFTRDDLTARDTNVFGDQRCYAYFQPLDPNADILFQDQNNLGTVRDIRQENPDTTLLYKVVFSAGRGATNCYPVTICVDPNTDFPAGARIVIRDTANGSIFSQDLRTATENGSGQRCYTIKDPRIQSFYIEYTTGTLGRIPTFLSNAWNLISLPVVPPDARPATVFPNSSGTPYYFTANSAWNPVDRNAGTLEFGRGYMVRYGTYFGGDTIVAGVQQNQVRNVRVDQGWNSVGALSTPTSVDGIFFTPLPGLGAVPALAENTDVWEYVPTHGYKTVAFMDPGHGYFIKVDTPGYYNLNLTQAPPRKLAANQSLENSLGKVTVRDAAQGAQDLFFGAANTTVSATAFEMPPMVMGLDARFADTKGYINYNQDNYTVSLRGASYPVAMNFSNLQGEVEVRDMNGNVLGTASNGSSVVIKDRAVSQVVLAMKSSVVNATGFGLEQNFPNPFNPTTSIAFTVPTETKVTLTVYNTLGQAVRTLVDGVVKAGRHDVTFDASDLGSGTYLYKLQAGSFSQTAKMTLKK